MNTCVNIFSGRFITFCNETIMYNLFRQLKFKLSSGASEF